VANRSEGLESARKLLRRSRAWLSELGAQITSTGLPLSGNAPAQTTRSREVALSVGPFRWEVDEATVLTTERGSSGVFSEEDCISVPRILQYQCDEILQSEVNERSLSFNSNAPTREGFF
jgi:hypothetical protein